MAFANIENDKGVLWGITPEKLVVTEGKLDLINWFFYAPIIQPVLEVFFVLTQQLAVVAKSAASSTRSPRQLQCGQC